jgi:hypothetical protein
MKFIRYIQHIMGIIRISSFLSSLFSVAASTTASCAMLSVSSILSDADGGDSVHFSSGVFCPERFMSPLMVEVEGVKADYGSIWIK